MVALLADIPRITCPTPGPRSVPELERLGERGVPGRSRPGAAVLLRRRMMAVAVLVVLVMALWFGLQAALGRIGGRPLATIGAPGGLQPAASRIWIVRPGDSLWTIAEAVDPRGDVRPLVDRLAEEVGTTALYPGEPVAIPSG